LNKWDICAGEALLKSIGGTMMSTSHEKFSYNEEKSTWACKQGFLACNSSGTYLKISQKCFKDNK